MSINNLLAGAWVGLSSCYCGSKVYWAMHGCQLRRAA